MLTRGPQVLHAGGGCAIDPALYGRLVRIYDANVLQSGIGSFEEFVSNGGAVHAAADDEPFVHSFL